MILLERRMAGLFRAALRRCLEGPHTLVNQVPILVRQGRNGLLMHACHGEYAILYHQPGPAGQEAFAFPAAVLGQVEGKSADPVELSTSAGKSIARWTDQGIPREIEVPILDPESVPPPPELPKEFVPLPANFARDFHEASLSTARSATKYVFHRVLLQGQAGAIAGTDSRQLLLQGGYRFPFTEDVLVPRSGVFGLPPFRGMPEPLIGKTDTHVAFRLGAWLFAFTIDKEGRFPDPSQLISGALNGMSRLCLDPDDADFLTCVLAGRPISPGQEELAVTLDLHEPPCVRFRDGAKVYEVALNGSACVGKELRCCLDLKWLLRAVNLGFREIAVSDPKKPLLFRDAERTYLAMPFSCELALPPHPEAVRLSPPAGVSEPRALAPLEARMSPARPLDDLPAFAEPVGAALQPLPGQPLDLLGEAENLRNAVLTAAGHAGRLLHYLRTLYRQPQLRQLIRQSLHTLTDRPAHSGDQLR